MSDALRNAATAVLDLCRARGWKVATAESCTGGLVAGALTEIAGSSDVVDRGFVTYSNEAKQQMLGVAADTLRTHGAVSQQTAEAMARGALGKSDADVVVAITGIAGALGAIVVQFVAPDGYTFQLAIAIFLGMVVGGVGWLPGSLAGSAFIVFVPNIAEGFSKGLSGAIFGVFLIAVIFLVPHGARQVARTLEHYFHKLKGN